MEILSAEERALTELLRTLAACSYQFVCPNNATYRELRARDGERPARDLRDVLGWGLPFQRGEISLSVVDLLERSGMLVEGPEGCRSRIRVSTLDDKLFVHSAFPAEEPGAVFLGPDSYRFAEFLRRELPTTDKPLRILDIGAGAGVGGLVAAGLAPRAHVLLSDVNPRALSFARVNAAAAGVVVETALAPDADAAAVRQDVVIANPPFIAGRTGKLYSEGGAELGTELSRRWAAAAVERLAPGGRMLLYTGAPIVAGRDLLRQDLERLAEAKGIGLRYRELDPDIFGDHLGKPAYAGVERIAAVGAVLTAPAMSLRAGAPHMHGEMVA